MAGLSSVLVSIIERLVPSKWMKRYEVFIYSANINFLAAEYLVVSILMGVIAGLLAYIASTWMYSLAAFLAVFLLMAFGYPYWRVSKRTEEMERMLPDAFFYLASSLRAGISFSEALEELTTAKFGPLTDEFRKTVAEIKKGRPTVDALKSFAIRNRKSTVIYRSMMIIIEALERGAPMSDVLVFVGNDVREILRIKQERKASTGMQVMFFIITSGVIGPLILGVVAQIMASMNVGDINLPVETVKNILLGFVVLQAIASGLGIGVIREGKYSAGLKYSLLLAIMGVIVYEGASGVGLTI
ncbi:type II secretion system F family protein [Thermococcus sp. 18S1]|uniref:type II secretion system F family protein n=1 Tax=Thermococcus sp. 18S1 TaxID=1638210 RepID=UPI0014392743|nr:type II secretion system F family protein [Thermococcus sp. 18S1]NJE30151.1 type II secretion system F family protein [Thermococcus sp. 18S1]